MGAGREERRVLFPPPARPQQRSPAQVRGDQRTNDLPQYPRQEGKPGFPLRGEERHVGSTDLLATTPA